MHVFLLKTHLNGLNKYFSLLVIIVYIPYTVPISIKHSFFSLLFLVLLQIYRTLGLLYSP